MGRRVEEELDSHLISPHRSQEMLRRRRAGGVGRWEAGESPLRRDWEIAVFRCGQGEGCRPEGCDLSCGRKE